MTGSACTAKAIAEGRETLAATVSAHVVNWFAAPELRINDQNVTWRIVYRIDSDAMVILEVFRKSTAKTPAPVIHACKRRMRMYDDK